MKRTFRFVPVLLLPIVCLTGCLTPLQRAAQNGQPAEVASCLDAGAIGHRVVQ